MTMLKEEIEVYSDTHDIYGVIKDYGFVTKLFFSYKGKEIVMGINRNPLRGEKFEEIGSRLIDTYVSDMASPESERKIMLHYWYIGEHYIDQKIYHVAHGIVTGHKRLNDSISMHTSAIRAVHIDKDTDEALITTHSAFFFLLRLFPALCRQGYRPASSFLPWSLLLQHQLLR